MFSRLELPEPSSSLKHRVGTGSKTISPGVKSRLGNIIVPALRGKQKEGGLYSDDLRSSQRSVHSRLGGHEVTAVSSGNEGASGFIPTMVADKLEISQHSDVHARLRKQGKVPKVAVSQSSLRGRLGKHAVFNRLE